MVVVGAKPNAGRRVRRVPAMGGLEDAVAHRVTHKDRSGKACKASFPTRALAEAYARTVRGAVIDETADQAPTVVVTRGPDGTAEAQRAASKAFFPSAAERRGSAAPRGAYVSPEVAARRASEERAEASERQAEAMGEFFAEARAMGVPMETAFADWDFVQSR
jgi:hypothetical protein